MKHAVLLRALGSLIALGAAAAIWFPAMHLFFRPNMDDYFAVKSGISPKARAIAAYQLDLWKDPGKRTREVARMRTSNAEWDFMGRTFLVLSLANMALHEPDRQEEYLKVMDRIIEETIRFENDKGIYFFLMDYAREGKFSSDQPASIFIDGETALMLGARRMVRERTDYKPMMKQRIDRLVKMMTKGPVLCAESYPNECWMFCNTVALATLRISDVLDGSDHSAFLKKWVAMAKTKLIDVKSGLLFSSFGLDGTPLDGPEGSSIWMVSHCLQIVDPSFANDQYARARKELATTVFGFGYAKEWPACWRGSPDIDSGPIVPVLDASAGSSGLALIGASAFKDSVYLKALITSLNFAAFPNKQNNTLRYCASNQVGDAVILYSLVNGPLWDKVLRAKKAS